MGKPDAFLHVKRQTLGKQPVEERLRHCQEIYCPMDEADLRSQASRCMECGVPFCHGFACPLGNIIPEWNTLMYQGRWREACDLLHHTNNFPEITGRVCPALCEASCVLGLEDEPVTIRQNEYAIVERAWSEGWISPRPPKTETGRRVAIIGSGPAGLAAAQQLRRAGHQVTVYEKSPRPGGILRYGIPDFKLNKGVLDRRLAQLQAEGVVFETDIRVGQDVSSDFILKRFDAVGLCIGAGVPRDLVIPGRELSGIHFAMDFLVQHNIRVSGLTITGPDITAAGKKVVIIGGGDTGADCLGTALRQGATSVHQLEILPRPPRERDPSTPWPTWPNIMRTSTSHEEGGERIWSVATTAFHGTAGRLTHLRGHAVRWDETDDQGRPRMTTVSDSDFEMEVDLVLLAMGFTQPDHNGLLESLGVEYDERGNVRVDQNMAASIPKVFAAGDAASGASLVVRAIAAGRRMARSIDLFLMGESDLPAPFPPSA